MLLSPFIFWVALFVVGSYFMFSFDKKVLSQPAEPGVMGTVKHYYDALGLSYIKKGIDLAGGTYLVLGVEIEKALENRLGNESRAIDTLFKNKGLKVLPTKKEIKDLTLALIFPDEESAKIAYNMIQEARMQSLKLKVSDGVVYASFMPEVEQSIRTGAVEQGVNVLTNRLGGYGVEGIVVQQHGDRQIVVQLPGVDDSEHIKSSITKTALLEFKIVEKTAASKEVLLDEFDGELPSDKMIIAGRHDGDPENEEVGQWYLVPAFPDLTGDHIVTAKVDHDEYNRPVVSFKLDGPGGREFGELTSNNVGRRLGIIIDNIMITAPNINTAITGGSGIIQGIGSVKEAFDLSIVLKSGSLHAPLKIDHENRVGASLGQDSINKGLMSCLIALLLLFIFSLIYYKIPGLFAIITLIANIFLTMLFLSYFRATLTMPGIAGIVLTIGMAIDASILIYERTKEELALGAPLRKAIFDGFNGAMAVIMDSNITTLLTGIVLFQFGGPAIKGFAVTLMAGIVATVLTGVYFLKSMYSFVLDILNVKQLKF
jgi:preprotein translocase subunit SecD